MCVEMYNECMTAFILTYIVTHMIHVQTGGELTYRQNLK